MKLAYVLILKKFGVISAEIDAYTKQGFSKLERQYMYYLKS